MAPAQDDEPSGRGGASIGPTFQWSGTGADVSLEQDESSGSGDDDGDLDPSGAKPNAPMQKRRRVTRACDECRRKKIKCDGKQPCTHCTVYSYDCTYDQPSNRRRNPAPQYIEAIENRLHRAEALLKTVMPNVDLDDPSINPNGPPPVHFPQPGYEKNAGKPPAPPREQPSQAPEVDKDSMLESMVQSTGSLDIDDRGYWDFSGHSSGLVFLKRLREQFGDIMGEAEGHGNVFLTKTRHFSHVLDSPRTLDSPGSDGGLPNTLDLPSKECGRRLCDVALKDGLALMRFIHLPTLHTMLNRIYDTPPEHWTNEENRYLPLVYAILAVGSMFATDDDSNLRKEGYEGAIEAGFKYFKASRQLMDITDCRDLPSLQAIVCMILFLQASAKLSVCYSYIGIALHSAIRLGLHRSINGKFDPIETEVRKRLFWQIRKMGIYVGAMLGLPIALSDDDIDQVLPEEIDDEYLTIDGPRPMPPGYTPLFSATNAHTRLVMILKKVTKYIYPIKGIHSNDRPQSYSVSHAKVREIERDLSAWMDELPDGLKPGGTTSEELQRVQQLLRMSYAHVQLSTYRPFLHYASQDIDRHKIDKRSYACAAACISVARNIIHITAEMSRRGLLEGAYWFTMYTTFMAILALIFFIFENPQNPSCKDILKDAIEGREILAKIATRSMAADRCSKTLAGLFSYLEKVKDHRPSQTTKKRHASPDPRAVLAHSKSQHVKSHSVSKNGTPPKRASTLPTNAAGPNIKRPSYPFTADPYLQPAYTGPADGGSGGISTPDSMSASSSTVFANSPVTQVYNAPFGSFDNNTNLPDLTSMMFPSNDPFAYPNQPMTTLEDAQINNFGSDLPDLAQTPQSGVIPTSPTAAAPQNPGFSDGSMDMQIFGMPPYLMQGHHQAGLGMGLGLFPGENAGGGAATDDAWAGLGKQENIDWGTWGEGNFGG